MTDLPWPISGEIDQERECGRCGEMIPPHWRHFWEPCLAAVHYLYTWPALRAAAAAAPAVESDHLGRTVEAQYLPLGQPPHIADPACEKCEGTGYLPCQLQDLSILRRSGYCSECGESAFVLVRCVEPVGEIEGSARHFDPTIDHEVPEVAAGPLVRTLSDYLDRAGRDRR